MSCLGRASDAFGMSRIRLRRNRSCGIRLRSPCVLVGVVRQRLQSVSDHLGTSGCRRRSKVGEGHGIGPCRHGVKLVRAALLERVQLVCVCLSTVTAAAQNAVLQVGRTSYDGDIVLLGITFLAVAIVQCTDHTAEFAGIFGPVLRRQTLRLRGCRLRGCAGYGNSNNSSIAIVNYLACRTYRHRWQFRDTQVDLYGWR